MILSPEEREKSLFFAKKFTLLERNWDVVREHLLCIKASTLHASVKLFLLVLSILTIFLDSSVIILLALLSLPGLFIFKPGSIPIFMRLFENSFVPSQERWDSFTFINFCETLAFISFRTERIWEMVFQVFTECPLIGITTTFVVILNAVLLWMSLTLIRIVALSLIVIYTTPVLWYYQLDRSLLRVFFKWFIPRQFRDLINSNAEISRFDDGTRLPPLLESASQGLFDLNDDEQRTDDDEALKENSYPVSDTLQSNGNMTRD